MSIDLADAVVRIGAKLDGLTQGLNIAKRSTSLATNAIQGLFQGMGQQAFRSLQNLLFSPFRLAMSGMQASIQGVFDQMKGGLSGARDLETALAEVSTLGAEDMNRLRKGVLELSGAIGEDAVRMTRALYQALSAGVPEDNVLSFLEISAKAAKAGLTDTETMVNALTSVIASYNLSFEEATSVGDKFFATIKKGKTTAGELAPVIGRIAPLASAAGLSLDELFSSLATITQSGISTAEAVTGLRGSLQAFIKPSEGAAKALETIGIPASNARQALGEQGLLGILQKAQGAGVLEQLVEQLEALPAALSLVAADGKIARDSLDVVSNSAGLLAEATSEMADTTAAAQNRLAETWAAIRISIMSPLNDIIGEVADWGRAFLEPIQGAVEEATSAAREKMDEWLNAPFSAETEGFIVETTRGQLLKNEFARLGEAVVDNFKQGTERQSLSTVLKSWIESSHPEVQRIWNDDVDKWIQVIVQAWRDNQAILEEAIGTVWDGVLKPLIAKVGPIGVEIGESIMRGVIKGMGNLYMEAMSYLFVQNKGDATDYGRFGSQLLYGYASGGPVRATGNYLVGEDGPEVVELPKGANVIPNNQLGREVHIHVNVQGANPDDVVAALRQAQRLGTLGAY